MNHSFDPSIYENMKLRENAQPMLFFDLSVNVISQILLSSVKVRDFTVRNTYNLDYVLRNHKLQVTL